MILTRKDITFLRKSGTRLVFPDNYDPSLDRQAPANFNGKYQVTMYGNCGNLQDDGLCHEYTNPTRPRICKTTKVSSDGCTSCRQAHNLDPVK